MQLYKITNEYENVFNQVDENGELSEDMIKNLDSLQQDFENKAVGVASYIKNLEAEEEAISKAMEDMKIRKTRLAKQVVSLTEYLQFNLERLAIKEIKTSPYFKIRLKTCPPSVIIHDENFIPAEYWREKTTSMVDKIRIKEVLSEGLEVPGASIERRIKLEIK